MVKVYTRTGDRGTTPLFGGKRVDKNSTRIKAYGEVDELNSLIGIVLTNLNYSSSPLGREVSSKIKIENKVSSRDARTIKIKLLRIQTELFVLGADLATPKEVKVKIPRITKSFVTRLEKEIDKWSTSLPQLRNFILPGGSTVGAKLHLARTVARRAERSVVELSGQEKINKNAQVYINRLSDWLFTLARYVNKLEGIVEVAWKGRSKT